MFDTTIVLSPLYGWAKPDFDVQSSEIVPFWWVCLEVPYFSMGSYESDSLFHLDLGFQHPGLLPWKSKNPNPGNNKIFSRISKGFMFRFHNHFRGCDLETCWFWKSWLSVRGLTNLKELDSCHTVDGRNLAPVDMVVYPIIYKVSCMFRWLARFPNHQQ